MFVTGCHRSGTSLVASLLRQLLDLEQENADELPPAPDNPRGFQESKSLNRLNNQLLSLAGCRWDYPPLVMPDWSSGPLFDLLFEKRAEFSPYALRHRWIEKNPRLCITASAMEHLLLKRVPFVVSLRSPEVVATSLYRRNGLSPQHGLLIWFLYNFHLASVLRSSDFFLTYESVLGSKADAVIEALFDFLERSGMDPDRQGIDRARKYIDGRLNRAGDGVIDFSGDASVLAQGCRDCYEACVSGDGPIECFKSSFASLPRSLVDQLSRYGRWNWAGLADSK